MTDPLILTIDLGTTGPKVALMNLAGNIICSARNNVPLIHVDSNGFEQDPNHWWVAIDQAISWVIMKSIEHKKDIIGISTSSHWSSCVFLNKDQKLIAHSIIGDDSRGAEAIKKLNKTLLPIAGYAPRKLWHWLRKSGGTPRLTGQDSLAHLLYMKDTEPKKFEQIHYVLEPKDYINYRLTGEIATSPETMALYWITDNRDCKNISYDTKLLDQLGLEKEIFPQMVSATSVVGELLPSLTEYWGLPKRLPVICGTPDIHSAIVGSGAVRDLDPHLYIGKSSWATCHVPHKKTGFSKTYRLFHLF